MSFTVARLEACLRKLNTRFLDVVRETITDLGIQDSKLAEVTRLCEKAHDWIRIVKFCHATEEEISLYDTLFKHIEVGTKQDYGPSEEKTEDYFAALECDVRDLLDGLAHRQRQFDHINNTITFKFSDMDTTGVFKINTIDYADDSTFVSMRRVSQKKLPARWLRYDNELRTCEEIDPNDYDLEGDHRSCDGDSNVPDKIESETKQSNDSRHIEVEPKSTAKTRQAQSQDNLAERIQSIPTTPLRKTPDKQLATTTQDEDADWEMIQEMEDFEIDMVMVR